MVQRLDRFSLRKSPYLISAFRLVWQSAPRWSLALLALLIIQGALPLAQLYVIQQVIDQLGPSLVKAQGRQASEVLMILQSLIPLLSVVGLLAVGDLLLSSLSELVNVGHNERVTNAVTDMLHAKSIELDLAFYENSKYFDALQRAQQEAKMRPRQILTALASVIQNGIMLIGLIGLLLSLHWLVGVTLLLAALPVALTRSHYSRLLFNWAQKRTALHRRALYISRLLTSDQHAKEVRLFNLGGLLRHRFRRVQKQLYEERLYVAGQQVKLNLGAQFLGGSFFILGYGYIVYQVLLGNISLGKLVLYYQALQRGQNALKQFLSSCTRLYENNLFLSNLFDFLALQPTILEEPQPLKLPHQLKQGVIFEHVSFSYPGTHRQALEDISLRVEPGETIALVGENGSGKTTLIKLLCRLYEPTNGYIHIEGQPLFRYALEDLRNCISVIFQDYARYHLTVRENIGLGNVDRHNDIGAIQTAAKRSGADAVIHRLPNGYETLLGKYFDGGEELSIGQWQKIALARAFLRASPILVLDEPTAAMDAKAEYAVFQQLQKLAHDKAVILISHRMSTVRMCDRIYLMDQGRITEWGTHDELMHRGDRYAHLFETQAKNYR